MTCDRVQVEISRALDEGGALSPRAAVHLSGCTDCDAFRTESMDVAERYATEVRAGIERLRGTETVAPPHRRRVLLPAILAAAVLLLCWGMVRVPPASPPAPAVVLRPASTAPAVSRVRLFESPELVDREEMSFLFEREALPVRLGDDLLPAGPDPSEIRLPPSLRF